MKKTVVNLFLVLFFGITFNQTVLSQKATAKENVAVEYVVNVNLVWENSNVPLMPGEYRGRLYAENTETGEFISAEYDRNTGIQYFLLKAGTYRFDGEDYYFVGICSQEVRIASSNSITLEVWSE